MKLRPGAWPSRDEGQNRVARVGACAAGPAESATNPLDRLELDRAVPLQLAHASLRDQQVQVADRLGQRQVDLLNRDVPPDSERDRIGRQRARAELIVDALL